MLRVERVRQAISVSNVACPACGATHTVDLEALIEQVVGVMHMMTSWTETHTCLAQCPTTGDDFAIDVDVTLWSGQTLLQVG